MKINLSNMDNQSMILEVLKFYMGRMEGWVENMAFYCRDRMKSQETVPLHEVFLHAKLKNGQIVELHEAQPDKKIAVHRVIERFNRLLMRQKVSNVSQLKFTDNVHFTTTEKRRDHVH